MLKQLQTCSTSTLLGGIVNIISAICLIVFRCSKWSVWSFEYKSFRLISGLKCFDKSSLNSFHSKTAEFELMLKTGQNSAKSNSQKSSGTTAGKYTVFKILDVRMITESRPSCLKRFFEYFPRFNAQILKMIYITIVSFGLFFVKYNILKCYVVFSILNAA